MEQLINSKLEELNSLPIEENGKPVIPVAIVIQEASDLYHTCIQDKEELISAKLDWSLVDDLLTRTGAVQKSQSKWAAKFKNYEACHEEWKMVAPMAYKFRNELVHAFRHALHHIPVEYAKVKKINEGSSHADMIQDLSDLAELGMNHIAELEAIGFDLSKLDEAKAMAIRLTKLLGEVNGSYKETSPLLELRNKAYIHLKEAVDEIRRVGQYVFWKNEKKVRAYSSSYLRKRNKAYSKNENEESTDTKE